MLLTNVQLISLLHNQVGLEDHVQRKKNTTISQKSYVSNLKTPDPFKYSGIFVNDFTLLKIKLITGILSRHFDKRLVSEGRMIEILFEFE